MTKINLCIISGRIIKKSDLTFTKTGSAVLSVTLAVEDTDVNSKGNEYPRTDFAKIVLWEKMALRVSAMPKNSFLSIDAKMQNNNYTAQDGTKRYVTEFKATEIHEAAVIDQLA